jgi:hypothetical protein
VVCFTDRTPLTKLIAYNNYCRDHQITFLYGAMDGVFSSIFTDFGSGHIINDADGLPEKFSTIDKITCAERGSFKSLYVTKQLTKIMTYHLVRE